MSQHRRIAAPVPQIRLFSEGTRVVVLGSSPEIAGVITLVRPETHLKSYVVTRDDGVQIFASAREVVARPVGLLA